MTGADETMRHAVTSGGGVTLRLFVALPVPIDVARRLASYGESDTSARPSEATSMHVTFAFLGDVPEEHVHVVAATLDRCASRVSGATSSAVSGARSYGDGRVAGVDVDYELLALLDAARDEFLLAVAPYAPQLDRRAWRPHVTVARGRDLSTEAALPMPPAASWITSELRLFASLPAPGGRQHRILHAVPFGVPVPHA
jgi:2'-5' RNA ligase